MVIGFADVHNHQFAEWAFGGKFFWGQAYGPECMHPPVAPCEPPSTANHVHGVRHD